MIWKLSKQLSTVPGKKTYGYLPKPMKRLVDAIVDQMARLPTVDTCYQTWWELQCQVETALETGAGELAGLQAFLLGNSGTGGADYNGDGVVDGMDPVSYTHLDVYKRQVLTKALKGTAHFAGACLQRTAVTG